LSLLFLKWVSIQMAVIYEKRSEEATCLLVILLLVVFLLPNFLKSAYSFLALSLPFLASFVPLPPVALVIPIL
jgi:hypothetical protein